MDKQLQIQFCLFLALTGFIGGAGVVDVGAQTESSAPHVGAELQSGALITIVSPKKHKSRRPDCKHTNSGGSPSPEWSSHVRWIYSRS